MRHLLAFVFLAALALVAPVQALHADAQEDLQEYLERCEAFGWSGVVVVQRKGKRVFEAGFGLADRESGRENDAKTLFELASITKPITAVAILSLVEDGKLGLDDSIAKHLPGVPEHARSITVRHLLAHTSGMPRAGPSGSGDELEAAVQVFLGGAPTSVPGTKHEYWNGGYALLAGILEQVTGDAYADVVRQRVFRPAKMKSSGFTGDELPVRRQAVGYEPGAESRLAAEHPYGSYGWQYKGMGGAVATAADLARLVWALLEGDVLEAETLEAMWTEVQGSYGLGWGVTNRGGRGLRFSHGGDVRGFHGYVQATRDQELIVVVLSNVGGIPTWKLAANVEALALGNQPPQSQPPQIMAWKARDLNALAGKWATPDGERVVLTVEGAGLAASPQGLRIASALSGTSADVEAVEREVALVERFLAHLDGGEANELEQVVSAQFAGTWPKVLIDTVWRKQRDKWGKLSKASAISFEALGNGRNIIYLALDHERGRSFAKTVTHMGKVSGFSIAEQPPSSRVVFVPVGKKRLVTFDWSGETQALELELKGTPKAAKVLSLRVADGAKIKLERLEDA